MATFHGTTGHSLWTWKIEVWETDVNIANNTSIVHVASYMGRNSTNSYFGGNAYITTRADGQWRERVFKNYAYPTYVNVGQWLLMHEEAFTITHDADGSKTITVGSQMDDAEFNPGWTNVQGTFTLTTIPRTSKPSFPSKGTLESNLTFNTNRASSSFTHKLIICRGTTVYQTISNQGATISWTPSLDTYARLITGNPPSGNFQMICETYNGSTKIGQESATISLTVPNNSSTKPSLSLRVEEAVSEVASKNLGFFVKNKSKVKAILSASGKYSASISSYSTSVNGITYGGSQPTSNPLTSTGNLTVSSTVKDSRGFTNSASQTIKVVDYFNPTISGLDIIRVDENGNPSDEGQSIKFYCTYKFAPLENKNQRSFLLFYKVKGSSGDWTPLQLSPGPATQSEMYDYTYNGSQIVEAIDFSPEITYEFYVLAEDLFGKTETTFTLKTAFDIINVSESGQSIAFGKISSATNSERRIDLALQTYYKEEPLIEYKRSRNLLLHPYTVDNKVTLTASYTDHYVTSLYSVYLEAGKTYTMSYETDDPSANTEMYIITWAPSVIAYSCSGTTCKETFTPRASAFYKLRWDVNTKGTTASFWNFQVELGTERNPFERYYLPKLITKNATDTTHTILDLAEVDVYKPIWEGKALGASSIIYHDFKCYKKIRIYFNNYSISGSFEVDLTHPNAVKPNDECSYAASGYTGYLSNGRWELHYCQVALTTNLTELRIQKMGYYYNSTVTERNSNENYYVYKVEGVPKE